MDTIYCEICKLSDCDTPATHDVHGINVCETCYVTYGRWSQIEISQQMLDDWQEVG